MEHTMKIERWTTEMATAALEKRDGQRRISKSHVAALKRDMEAGRWITTPLSPICIGEADSLINGQHRLRALSMMPEGFFLDLYVLRLDGVTSAAGQHVDVGIYKRRTGFSAGLTDSGAAVTRFLLTASGVVTPTVAEIREAGPGIVRVEGELTATARARVTAAAIKSAAVARILCNPKETSHVTTQYWALANQAYGQMCPAVQSLNKRLTAIRNTDAGTDRQRYSVAAQAFDPARSNLERVFMRSDSIEEGTALARLAVIAAIAASLR